MLDDGLKVNVVTVVSPFNQNRLEEVVDELLSTHSVASLFLSLQDEVGRAKGLKSSLNYKLIGDKYLKIWKKYRENGVNINLTGTDIHAVSMYPCAVAAPNFSISPDGDIHSCTIVFNEQTEFSDSTYLGRVNSEGVFLDTANILRQTGFNILNTIGCEECFAKWHCRGGCPYARNNERHGSILTNRCEMIKRIVLEKLYTIITDEND